MNKSHIFSVASSLLLFISASANASYIYSYTGNNFNNFSTTSAWDTSMGVSGSFELPNALGSNLIGSQITPTSFSFTDGVNTIADTDMVGDPQLYNVEFGFYTDSNGNITSWSIYLDFGPVGTPFYPDTLGSIGDKLVRIHTTGGLFATAWDIGTVFTCAAINPDGSCTTDIEYGDITFSPGAWTVSSVPIPSAAWLFGSGILGLIGISRRKKAAQSIW